MNCPKCGCQNRDDAQLCHSCGCELTKAPATAERPLVQTSGLAIASLVLAILTPFTLGLTAIPAIILGIIALVLIEKSGGRLTSRGFAKAGIAVPVFTLFLIIILYVVARARHTCYRMICRSHLHDIGLSMLIYANDYDDKFPRAGGLISKWGPTPNWQADNRDDAYGLSEGADGQASISANFYVLYKSYFTGGRGAFVCPGDSGTSTFDPTEYGASMDSLHDLWDFGPDPAKHCSYTYHMPYGLYPLKDASPPGLAVAADRNPFIGSPGAKAVPITDFNPTGTVQQKKNANSPSHRKDGQNVLFMDSHVGFEKVSFCGINYDNIYTYWDGPDIRRGAPPKLGSQPADKLDSLLVHDPPIPDHK